MEFTTTELKDIFSSMQNDEQLSYEGELICKRILRTLLKYKHEIQWLRDNHYSVYVFNVTGIDITTL